MASTGKKEYSIKINGVTQGITDVTKLEKAVSALDSAFDKQRTTVAQAANNSKAQAKALSDEEKAAKKLLDTKARIAAADSAANKAQIAATRELRERTREVTRAVIQDNLAEDSIASMGMQLTDLRLDYEALTAAQRADETVGAVLLKQIQDLDKEYKALRESTGNFRDSVGNYEKALKGLGDLKDGLDKVNTGSSGLAASLIGSNDVLDLFGDTTKAVSVASEGLQGVIALGTQAAYIYNSVMKDGVVQQKAAAAIDAIRTWQLRAKAAAEAQATKGTILATIAQKAFNIVAAANPYVLIALALASVIGAIYLFALRTDQAAEKQKEFNELQAIAMDQLDQYAEKLNRLGESRVNQIQNEIDVLRASGAATGKIRDAENKLFRERAANNARLRGFYGEELADLEKNRQKIEELREVLRKLNNEKARGESKITLDIDLDGKVDKVDIEAAIDAVQGQVDNLGRKVTLATEINTDRQALENEARVTAAARAKEDRDRRKEQAAVELGDLRALQDNKAKILDQTFAEQRAALKRAYDREVEDLRNRLRTEENLTQRSRELINANIVALGKVLAKQEADLRREQRDLVLQDARAEIDSYNALIIGASDRATAELKTRYERQINDLQKRLDEDATLNSTQQAYITNQIINAQILRDRELAAIQANAMDQRASTQLAKVEYLLAAEKDKITKFTGELQVRDKEGLQLIDVDATRKNLEASNVALAIYINGIKNYQNELKDAHKAVLATLQEGTPEYEAELDKYTRATQDNAKKIAQAQNEQAANTKANQNVQVEYYRDAAAKITAIAQETVAIFQQGADLFASAIEAQLDSLNSALDEVNTKYDESKTLSEKSAADVQATEALMQQASGGTAEALKGQLADQMRARNEAQRQEQRYAKEKEKLEADIRKKEKQAKRVELLSNIAQATANGFAAVTQALAAFPPPFSYVAAAITGAFAAVQVTGMTKQLTKLQDGGEIHGPRHSDGGVPIGLGYEAEGGEYMVSKVAYSNSPELVRFINENNGIVSAEDLVGLVPGGASMVASETLRNSNQDIVEAIEAIDIRPVVSVAEIQDVADQIVSVQELAGYNN